MRLGPGPRQEMKWGVFFVKKWKMVVFCKQVENGGGVFLKMDLSSTQGALCTVSVFFIFYFTFWGVRTQPPAYWPEAYKFASC